MKLDPASLDELKRELAKIPKFPHPRSDERHA